MSNELYHHGILGMKWGVRRKQNESGVNMVGKKTKIVSEDYAQAKSLKKKKLYEMSNSELETLNRRMQLEQNYKNLNRQKVSKGQKIVTDVLSEVGKSLVKDFISGGVNKGKTTLTDKIKKKT